MKKLIWIVLFWVIVIGFAGAQDRASNVRDNWISAELSLLGIGARYERMINPSFSFGVNAYLHYFFEENTGFDITGRFYPWGKNFLVGIGLGFHNVSEGFFVVNETASYEFGFTIVPEVGWKIDVGNDGGFFLQPGVKLPITLAAGGVFAIAAYLGMGYAF